MSAPSRQASLPGMESLETPQQTVPEDSSEEIADIANWTICAVDAHSLIFQVFHALPEMTSPKGEPVGAVYGFVRDLLQLVESRKPDALLCAFDLPGPTFRHDLFDGYKADRGSMPEDLASQIPKIRDVLAALGIPIWSSPGFEADDVLATVARSCDELGARCLIVTGDKDCRQLITDHVVVYNIRKDLIYDAESLHEDWGIRPDQVVDFQALVGDKVDCVPGVPLIGPKKAQELLATYGTLESLLDHAEEVKGAKRKQNLIDHREDALLSRKLVRLDTQVPITPDWAATQLGGGDLDRVSELFQEFGFRSLGERVQFLAGSSGRTVGSVPKVESEYRLVNTADEFDKLVKVLANQTLISVDTETTDVHPRFAEIVGFALAFTPGEGYYIPVMGPPGETILDSESVANTLKPILEDPNIEKVGQNLKYDMVVLRKAGIHLEGTAFDTMLASYLLEAGERSHNLDQLASRHLDHQTIKIEELIGKGKNQKRMDEVPLEKVAQYASEDADIPLQLYPILSSRLEKEGLSSLHDTLELPLIDILADMEFQGISINTKRLQELSDAYAEKLNGLTQEIEELAGHPLNIASPKQLRILLFEELGLPVIKKTKTGPSTDAGVLDELAPLHPLPAKIVEHRQYSKLLNTYINALPEMVHPETGRVHASFNQVVAATGRLSSSNPNLQNIPIRTEAGKEIRSAFRASQPDWKLLAADYSQIELRVLAHFSGDETLCQAFANDEDIHALVASQVEGVELDEVTSDMRRRAKAVNFGIIYGQSPFGLAKSLGISQDEAASFIEMYFERYPGVLGFFTQTLQDCRENGYVSTLSGRRRAIQGVRPVPEGLREAKTGALRQLNLPERTAVNTVIQGSAADLIKIAMIKVHQKLQESDLPAAMLLQIHDELVFEVEPGAVDDLAQLVVTEMSQAFDLGVPLKIDVEFGDNWADCEAWEGFAL